MKRPAPLTPGPLPDYLTTAEAADFLRLGERKIYDLVAAGDIPHIKITGKLLFPKALVEAWLARNVVFAPGVDGLAMPPPVIAGSDDPLLSAALRMGAANAVPLATRFGGSLAGLRLLAARGAMVAACHLPAPEAPLGASWNTHHIERTLAGQPVAAIEWAKRRQGLVVAEGNPLGLAGVHDLSRARVSVRPKEAGSFVLLTRLLDDAGLDLARLQLARHTAQTETDVALAVAAGDADAGFAIEAVARQHKLDFLPLVAERLDLVVWRHAYFEPPVQALLAVARTAQFIDAADRLGGYDISDLGRVHYNGG